MTHRSPLVLVVAFAFVMTSCSEAGSMTPTADPPTAPSTTGAPDGTADDPTAADGWTGAGSGGENATGPVIEKSDTVDSTGPSTTEPSYDDADYDVAAGTEQLTITGARPRRRLAAFDETGAEVANGVVDEVGALVLRGLTGGATFTVGDTRVRSAPIATFTRDDHPTAAFHAEQRLPTDGLGYSTTRDGTTLSASIWLPGPADEGPYPTVVEYSGYSPSNPDSTGFPDLFNALGYAYVGVNIRGTGCSGGSFRYFEYAQSLDGYDAIEAVATQPWVARHRVGMVGVSYPGISQLFVAQTRPPSLAAIAPFSVLADSAISTLYPGGILNTGFAVPWTAERLEEAAPGGQAWAADRIAAGDAVCDANQDLRLQNPDLLAEIFDNPYWTDEVAGEIAPRLFVDRIAVPTFVAGAWQDEQTGGHFATMLDRFTGTEHLYATLVNGLHTESIGPAVFPRLVEFLDLYVAERTPSLTVARTVVPALSRQLFHTSDVALPDTDRFEGMSPADALAVFEAEPPIRVLFEEGAADGFGPRTPMPRFEAAFDAWPVPTARTTRWLLDDTGRLGDASGAVGGATSYLALPDATPPTFYVGSSLDIWSVDVDYRWVEGGPGSFAAWATDPLDTETAVIGSGSVDLYVGVDAPDESAVDDTDLEVTISEVRPDGKEVYVQSGWLRASQRALDEEASTEVRPVQTHLESDAAPLPDGFELVRVEIFPFAHVFRAGSRIRLAVDAPGGNRPVWEFRTIAGGERVSIAHSDAFPSALVLPVVPGVDAPDEYPGCTSLRGQPCRDAAVP